MKERPLLATPYPGLRPFEAADHRRFFGREKQISAMLAQLEDNRFVAVVGSSGSGKSSLVRAGLLPALDEGFLGGTTDWLKLVIRPGHDPFGQLAAELALQTGRRDDIPSVPVERSSHFITPLTAELQRTELGLLTVLAELAVPATAQILLVVDQFEEIFAFRRADGRRNDFASRDTAAAFVRMLLSCAAAPHHQLWVVITMRSDFIGDCEAFLGLPEAVSRSQFLVPRLDRSQMKEAIERPGQLTGVAYDPFTFETGLVNRILNEAGDRPDQLPLLQHALMRTWQYAHEQRSSTVLEIVEYEKAGPLNEALSRHADEALREFMRDRPERLVERVFCALCTRTPSGDFVRRPSTIAQLAAESGFSTEDVTALVEAFSRADRSFLMTPAERPLLPAHRIDISHESLLRQWKKLNEWIQHEAESADQFKRLIDAHRRKAALLVEPDLGLAIAWEERNRPTEAWAQRYGGERRDALEYLEKSQDQREKDRLRELAARRRELRTKRTIFALVGLLLLLIPSGAIYLDKRDAVAKAKAEATKAEAVRQKDFRDGLNKDLGGKAGALGALVKAGGTLRLSSADGRIALEFSAHGVSPDDALKRLPDSLKAVYGDSSVAPVRTLKLGGTGISDAGLAHIAGLTSLRALDLSHTAVSDAGLLRLAGLSGLEELNVTGCRKVTPAGLAALRDKLRAVRIVGPGPAASP